MSIALTALVLLLAPPSVVPQKASHREHGTVRRIAVEVPVDAADGVDLDDGLVLGIVLPSDAVVNAPLLVQIASDDGKPRDSAAFPLATPRRGPPSV